MDCSLAPGSVPDFLGTQRAFEFDPNTETEGEVVWVFWHLIVIPILSLCSPQYFCFKLSKFDWIGENNTKVKEGRQECHVHRLLKFLSYIPNPQILDSSKSHIITDLSCFCKCFTTVLIDFIVLIVQFLVYANQKLPITSNYGTYLL